MKYNFYFKKQQHETNKKADMKQSTKYETNSMKNAGKELCSLHHQTLNDVVTWHWKKLVN